MMVADCSPRFGFVKDPIPRSFEPNTLAPERAALTCTNVVRAGSATDRSMSQVGIGRLSGRRRIVVGWQRPVGVGGPSVLLWERFHVTMAPQSQEPTRLSGRFRARPPGPVASHPYPWSAIDGGVSPRPRTGPVRGAHSHDTARPADATACRRAPGAAPVAVRLRQRGVRCHRTARTGRSATNPPHRDAAGLPPAPAAPPRSRASPHSGRAQPPQRRRRPHLAPDDVAQFPTGRGAHTPAARERRGPGSRLTYRIPDPGRGGRSRPPLTPAQGPPDPCRRCPAAATSASSTVDV
jgi:hypothetical protein